MKSLRFATHLLVALLIPFARAQEKAPREHPEPPLPTGFRAVRNVEYIRGGGASRSLDLFVPEQKPNHPLPVIVWIHGGAWRAGSKEHPGGWELLRDGFALASINYRLSQEAVFPAQIDDCKAAIRFLRAKSGQYGIDPNRIGVFGSSAGGHLVALLGVAGDQKSWEIGDHLDQSSRVQAVCDWFGPTDLLSMGGQSKPGSRIDHDAPDSPESRLIGTAVQQSPEKARAASPISYISPDDAPMLIMHGDEDPLVPVQQSETFHAALQKAGVRSTLHVVRGGGHGPGFQAEEVQQKVRDFFIQILQPDTTPR